MQEHGCNARDEGKNVSVAIECESSLKVRLEDVCVDLDTVHLAASAVGNVKVVMHFGIVCTHENNAVVKDSRVNISVQHIRHGDVFVVARLAGIVDHGAAGLVGRDSIWSDTCYSAVSLIHDRCERLVCCPFENLGRYEPSDLTVRILGDIAVTYGSCVTKTGVRACDTINGIIQDAVLVGLPFLAVAELVYNDDITVLCCCLRKELISVITFDLAFEKDIEADNRRLGVIVNAKCVYEVSVDSAGPRIDASVFRQRFGIDTDYLDITLDTSWCLIKSVTCDIVECTEKVCRREQENNYAGCQGFKCGLQIFAHKIRLPL